jgi:hypothetical protein
VTLALGIQLVLSSSVTAATSTPKQSLQATAGRSDASIKIMKTHPLKSALALASGA